MTSSGHEWRLSEARDLRWVPEILLIRTTHWVKKSPMVWVEGPYDHTGASLEEVMAWVHKQEAQTDGEWQVEVLFEDLKNERAAITVYGRDPSTYENMFPGEPK